MNHLRTSESLNGWWDFRPELASGPQAAPAPSSIPADGWLKDSILVPGSWTRGGSNEDESEYAQKPWLAWRLFDSYGYPKEWDTMSTAWYCRRFTVAALPAGQRWFLEFDGVLRSAHVLLNGTRVGAIPQGIMPAAFDVTAALRTGENTVTVLVTEYAKDDKGKYLLPAGYDQVISQRGIWQDVRLTSAPEVRTEDVTIRTSVRRNELEVILTLRNDSAAPRTVTPRCAVREQQAPCLEFSGAPVTLPPGATTVLTLQQAWTGYRPWSPQSPQLYHLDTRLEDAGDALDLRTDRFGFREVWIEGPDLMLNDAPIHLHGDWGHKNSMENFRPEYVRQWYRMLKDCNMNYMRTHMFPHPKVLLELADEMGILVSLESAFAFGGEFALDKPEFWDSAADHVRSIVQRDKNHPSILLWSVGNEVRWSGNRKAIIEHYPRLIKLYQELDPTRITYCDGDSSLWDEKTQPFLSRHYGFECSGEMGWDHTQPLHVGETGHWHLAAPGLSGIWGDDAVFASAAECHRAMARESADAGELARANGVACYFPWNLSGLDNYRPWPEEHRHTWPDPAAPHVKPLRSAPYSSEFAWWEPDSPGYAPGPGFAITRHSFRPFAVIVREKRNRFYDDQPVRHTVTLVNDTGGAVAATLTIRLLEGDAVRWTLTQPVEISKGCRARFEVTAPALPAAAPEVERTIETVCANTAQTFDLNRRTLRITRATARTARWKCGPVAVLGDEPLRQALRQHGVPASILASLSDADPRKTPLLLIGKHRIAAGSTANKDLERFLRKGGRAVILEQQASPFPTVKMEFRPAERCFIRGGQADVLAGFMPEDFAFWGNDPYTVTPSDSWVFESPYFKPEQGNTRILLESNGGSWGSSGFFWTPLFETRVGKGLGLACQLRVTDKLSDHPVAARLLEQLLTYAAGWKPRPVAVCALDKPAAGLLSGLRIEPSAAPSKCVVASGAKLSRKSVQELAGRVAKGATALVHEVDARSAPLLAKAFGLKLQLRDLGDQYCLLRANDLDPLLDGLGHQELFWINRISYSSPNSRNHVIARTLIECPTAEPLLLSEFNSCWREFFELGAGTEWFRTPTLTHYLWNGPREHAAALLRIRHGKGSLLLCQMLAPTPDLARSRLAWKTLFHNLGATFAESPLEGDSIKPGGKHSDGFPTELILLQAPTPEMFSGIVRAGTPSGEMRNPNQALAAGFVWQDNPAPQGRVELPAECREAVLAYQVSPRRPRKATRVEGGFPDPRQQTLLDVSGEGTVTVYVNGKPFEPVLLAPGERKTVADIDLEQNWNTILLHWKGPAGAALTQLWRNRQGEPEVEFTFTGRGW